MLVSGQQIVSPAQGTLMDLGGLVDRGGGSNLELPLQGLVFLSLLGRSGLHLWPNLVHP